MPNLKSTYHSKIYQEFKSIELNEHLSIVRFYEAYGKEIPTLTFSEYFELLIAYVEALFEVGAYHTHLQMVDVALETSIIHNIKFFHGKDIFAELLFKKAAACYNLMEYKKAEHVLRELLKINPYHELGARFLKKCLSQQKPRYVRAAQAVTIFLFLMTAMLIAIEVFYIRTIYPKLSLTIESSRNTTFILAILVFAGSYLYHQFMVNYKINQFVAFCKQRKHNPSLRDKTSDY